MRPSLRLTLREDGEFEESQKKYNEKKSNRLHFD